MRGDLVGPFWDAVLEGLGVIAEGVIKKRVVQAFGSGG